MSKKSGKYSLSDQLLNLVNTRPHFSDEEDDIITQDAFPSKGEDFESDASSENESALAEFRKINIQMLDEEDQRYSGKKSSRKDFQMDPPKPIQRTDTESDEQDLIEDERSIEDTDEEKDSLEGESSIVEDSDVEENIDTAKTIEEPDHVSELNEKIADEIEKGAAVTNQLKIYDSILTCRIKFQKCLSIANQLPLPDNKEKFIHENENDYRNLVNQSEQSLKLLLNKLLDLQKQLIDSNTSKHGKIMCTDNTEIADILASRHQDFLPYRNETIQKWNDKTRVTQIGKKNFSAFEQTTLTQIEHVLADKKRIINRTRTKRSSYRILGETDEPEEKSLRLTEIYDDDDFYHQLLRELLERKTSDVTDPVQLGKQWIQLQKARNKMKKTVDTKASKGRKLRYGVHQKLVNFMMPVDTTTWEEGARSELFTSLFGKAV